MNTIFQKSARICYTCADFYTACHLAAKLISKDLKGQDEETKQKKVADILFLFAKSLLISSGLSVEDEMFPKCARALRHKAKNALINVKICNKNWRSYKILTLPSNNARILPIYLSLLERDLQLPCFEHKKKGKIM